MEALSVRMEDYVKAIYALQRDTDERISTSALADQLEVSPGSVTAMVKKLEERGLVDREEYRGVTLTGEGEAVALELLRHHRLIETFLTERLGYDWSEVHEEADVLEHHVSERFEERVAAALDNPRTDPHGDPIPDADLRLSGATAGPTLDELEADERFVVRRIRHQGEAELRYLADRGIRPGAELVVETLAPFGMVEVSTETGHHELPGEIARLVEGERAE
jgi:DtxR family Mn-dependent transcriptional regulator